MSHRVLGVDVSTQTIAIAVFQMDHRLHTLEQRIGDNPVRRLANTYELAMMWVGPNTIVIPEWPMGRSRYAQSTLDRVLGAFLAGCEHAAWVHHQGFTPSEWKKASVGKGNASKGEVAAWARATYTFSPSASQNVCDAIGIAHAGAAWWETRRNKEAA